MTISKAAKRREVTLGLMQGRLTFESVLLRALIADLEAETQTSWPNPSYQKNVVGFFTEVLGIQPWEKQVEVLEHVQSGVEYIQVPSGHKTGKSCLAVGIGLWNMCSFDDSRTVFTSTTDRQVNTILWRELKIRKAAAGRCVACKAADPHNRAPCIHSAVIPGRPADVARSGLRLPGTFNECFGFTAKEAEGIAGLSGPRQVFIVDEASGVDDSIFEALEGNMAGGNCLLLSFSNPTRDYGWFYNACVKKPVGVTVFISSEETPNAKAGEVLVPGLATAKYIETMRERWGEDSEWYRVRVKGQFSDLSSDTPFSVALLTGATMRWEVSRMAGAGDLVLGVDVAGDGLKSDDFVVAPRRGMTIGELHQGFKGDATAQAEHVLTLARQYRRGDELVKVCFDAEGLAGWEFYQAIYRSRDGNPWLQLQPVRTSKNAIRRPHMFKRISAEIVECGKRWLDAGGALPSENKLIEELHAWRFYLEQERGAKGALIYVDKDDVKKKVGRSPDRADAVFLSIWPWGSDSDDVRDDVERPVAMAVDVEERSADRGIVQTLRPDWGKRPADPFGDDGDSPIRPLGPWG